jgi:pimeloyl-ACP methyl ester carboxylesterase
MTWRPPRALAAIDGPVVLVGHSWGGAVITQAGNDPKVKALVYVAAFAPGPGKPWVIRSAGMKRRPLWARSLPTARGS